jgi:hypothetical protein
MTKWEGFGLLFFCPQAAFCCDDAQGLADNTPQMMMITMPHHAMVFGQWPKTRAPRVVAAMI